MTKPAFFGLTISSKSLDVTQLEGYFPILLKLEDKLCLVVGGGSVAERRIASLLEAKARVKVVSPEMTARIRSWSAEGRIEAIRRLYEPEDQSGAYLVVAATDSEEVNDLVCRRAAREGRLVNRAEHSELGDFIVPSVVRRGKLVIAVSTLGASPGVSAAVKKQLEASFGWEYEEYLDFLGEFRLKVQEAVQDAAERQAWYRGILQEDVLEKIRKGEFAEWKRHMLEQLHSNCRPFPVGLYGGKSCAESL